MSSREALNQFVRDALLADRSRAEIAKALADAGWSEREIRDAMSAYAESDFTPPVPRPQLTARDAFVYAILFTALGYTAYSLVALVHAILDVRMPDPADSSYVGQYATQRLRWSMSHVIVSAPVYLWMTVYAVRRIAPDTGQRRSRVRIWLTYLTLFVSVVVFLGDATYVIYSFLNGEATLRFILKAITVAVVAGAVFVFYLRDVREIGDAG